MFLILIVFLALAAPADTPAGYVKLRPSPELLAVWADQVFDQNTRWLFESRGELLTLMRGVRLPTHLRDELLAAARDTISRDEIHRAMSYYEIPAEARFFVEVREALWDRLPATFLRAVYDHQFHRGWGDGSVLGFGARRGWKMRLPFTLRRYATDPAAARALARAAFTRGNRVIVPVVPATWRHLNAEGRAIMRDVFLDDHPTRFGLDEPPPSLPPFAAARIGGYVDRPANCFDLAIKLLGPADAPEHPAGFVALERHLRRYYRVLREDEPPRPGDLKVYREPVLVDPTLIPYNVSIIVAPDRVITKNGLNKFTPYVLADEAVDHAGNDHADQAFTLTRYRHRDEAAYARACGEKLTFE